MKFECILLVQKSLGIAQKGYETQGPTRARSAPNSADYSPIKPWAARFNPIRVACFIPDLGFPIWARPGLQSNCMSKSACISIVLAKTHSEDSNIKPIESQVISRVHIVKICFRYMFNHNP